jgi:hypothetical protein
MFETYRRLAREAEISAPVPTRAVVVACDDLFPLYLPVIRAFEQGRTPEEARPIVREGRFPPGPDRLGVRGTTVLSMAAVAHRLRRTAPDELVLSTPEGTLLDGAWVQTLRSPTRPLPRGSVIRSKEMTATVLADRGGRPTEVAFRFDRPLDDPSFLFLTLAEGRLRPLALPAVGQELTMPPARPF